jgi:hypothetical protein
MDSKLPQGGLPARRHSIGVAARSVLVTAFAVAMVSCATETVDVALKPSLEHLPPLAEVDKAVAIRYPPEFLSRTESGPSHSGKTPVFAVGAASARTLDDVFSKVFRRAVTVRENHLVLVPDLGAVLVPEIREVAIQTAPPLAGRWWFVWGHITYRFSIISPRGDPIAAWEVIGAGEQVGDAQTETPQAVWTRILTRCIEDAGIRFMRSFYDVPEAKRWARNMTRDDVNAPDQGQVTETAADDATRTPGIVGLYPGIAKVEVHMRAGTSLALEVRVENQSSHPLLINPSGMALVLSSGKRLGPVPVYAYAASQLQRDATASGRLPYIAPPPISLQPSYFAVYNLIYALGALASMEAEKKTKEAFDAQLEQFRGNEFREKRLSARASITGDVHFVVPTTAVPAGQAHFTMPIVDLETATRHQVRLPISLKEGVKP